MNQYLDLISPFAHKPVLMSALDKRHAPWVVESGSARKELRASPKVTRGLWAEVVTSARANTKINRRLRTARAPRMGPLRIREQVSSLAFDVPISVKMREL